MVIELSRSYLYAKIHTWPNTYIKIVCIRLSISMWLPIYCFFDHSAQWRCMRRDIWELHSSEILSMFPTNEQEHWVPMGLYDHVKWEWLPQSSYRLLSRLSHCEWTHYCCTDKNAIFKCILLNENPDILIWILLQFVPVCWINDMIIIDLDNGLARK